MYYFMINPNAGSRMGRKVWEQLKSILIEEQIKFREFITRKPSDAKKIAEKLSKLRKTVKIVVVGGDGTLHQVLSGLGSTEQVQLGYLPVGSGNDFARGMGWNTDPVRQLESIVHPVKQDAIDYGCVRSDCGNGKFMVSAGVGFDAEICDRVNHSSSKGVLNFLHLGKLIYLFSGLRTFCKAKVFQAEIELDGKRKVFVKNILFLSVHNLPYEGGGIPFCPMADPRDGALDVCIVANVTKRKVPFLLMKALKGEHGGYRGIHIKRCTSIKIQTQKPQYLHMDGEVLGKIRRAEISVSKHQISMLSAERTSDLKTDEIRRGWKWEISRESGIIKQVIELRKKKEELR